METMTLCIQDLRTLLRAREIVEHLTVEGLEPAIERARVLLMATKGRRRYVQEILPGSLARAVPGASGVFVVECADAQRFYLHNGTVPLVGQIMSLEGEYDTQAIRVIHCNGQSQHKYWL